MGFVQEASAGEQKPYDVGESFRDCDDCPTMVVLPTGETWLGMSEDSIGLRPFIRGRTRAKIDYSFAIAETEITREQFAWFVSNTGYEPEIGKGDGGEEMVGCQFFTGTWGNVSSHNWRNPGFVQREDEPVVCVSYADATAYADWLSRITDRKYYIPSAVEFEYAAKAGTETAWYWGSLANHTCDYANVADQSWLRQHPGRDSFPCDDGFIFTSPVGHFQPNSFGLYDMIGNAWEWSADCWRADLIDTATDGSPLATEDGKECFVGQVVGGGWGSGMQQSRAANRSRDPIHLRSYYIGFRVARALPN